MYTIPDDLKVGIAIIDEQHQELLTRFSELSSADSEDSLCSEVQKTLDLLGNYIVMHFNEEEEMQIRCQFPMHEWHKGQHQQFVEEFQKLKEEYAADGATGTFIMNLDNTMIGWFKDHIKSADVEFGHFYRENNQ